MPGETRKGGIQLTGPLQVSGSLGFGAPWSWVQPAGPGLQPVSEPIPASAFAAGPVELQARREDSCYYLAVGSKPEDSIIGFTNPVWGLQAINPARPVPADRLVR